MKKYTVSVLIVVFVFLGIFFLKNPVPEIRNPKSFNPNISSELILISTGDIGLVRTINIKILQKKNPNYPFEKIAKYLRDADITITNLEGPLIENCPVSSGGFTFCGEYSNVAGLVYAGIDVASLANNHTTNYGLDGLNQTVKALESNNIKSFGLQDEIRYIEIKGKRIALVGFVELGNNWGGLNNATVENVSSLNQKADQNADIVINAFHFGNEYETHPTENQKLLAHTAIDNGADIVLGNHAHWIQDYEIYKDKPIVYAQGNTIFDQDWSQETREGILYKFAYRNGKFEKIDEKFTIIEENAQPRFATEEEIARIKQRLAK